MENNFLLTEDMLWDYADGFLPQEEKMQVDAYLRRHPEHQSMLDTILAEKKAFAALPMDRPKPGFADRVMAAWVAEQSANPSLSSEKGKDWIIWLIAAVFGLFLITPVVVMVAGAMQLSPEQLPAIAIPELPGRMPRVASSMPASTNSFTALALAPGVLKTTMPCA